MKKYPLLVCYLVCVVCNSCTNTVQAANSISERFWDDRKTSWRFPLNSDVLDINGGSRNFGAPRDGGSRAHAGVDLVPKGGPNTEVCAMTDGVVVAYYAFYAGTYALEIKNSDGTLVRYGEIISNLTVGTNVTKGQPIGKVIKNTIDGAYMLHLEVYMNSATGPLTDRNNTTYMYVPCKNYQRRSDLLDPMGVIHLNKY